MWSIDFQSFEVECCHIDIGILCLDLEVANYSDNEGLVFK